MTVISNFDCGELLRLKVPTNAKLCEPGNLGIAIATVNNIAAYETRKVTRTHGVWVIAGTASRWRAQSRYSSFGREAFMMICTRAVFKVTLKLGLLSVTPTSSLSQSPIRKLGIGLELKGQLPSRYAVVLVWTTRGSPLSGVFLLRIVRPWRPFCQGGQSPTIHQLSCQLYN